MSYVVTVNQPVKEPARTLRTFLVASVIVLGLCACGALPSAPSRQSLLELRHLELHVSPYADNMPRVALHYEAPSCDNLIVLFSIRSGTNDLPRGLEVGSVRLRKVGISGLGDRERLRDTYNLVYGDMFMGWAETWFLGHFVDARVRETYFVEQLLGTKPLSGRLSAPGEQLLRGLLKERVLMGAAVGCPPYGWEQGDLVEVELQIKAGDDRANLRAVGSFGIAS